MNSVWKSR